MTGERLKEWCISAFLCFFFSSRRRHTRYWRDWSSDVCSSDLRAWRRRRCSAWPTPSSRRPTGTSGGRSSLRRARDEWLSGEQPLDASGAPVRLAVVREQSGDPCDAGRVGLPADLVKAAHPLGVVRRPDGLVGRQTRPCGRARNLRVGRDVLPLAEERVVEGVLEGAEASLLAGPEARRQRERRARLVAREVDLDSLRERPAVDVPGPVGAEVIASRLEEGLRRGPELVREPLDIDVA